MSNLAVIPARGGSKRIPRKNIKLFFGKPIIAYSIEAAQKSNLFDGIVVSTDDDEIRDISQSYGADVPFVRPESLADDHTGTLDVIKHAIQILEERHLDFENICCIYPTAPFLMPEIISGAYKKLISADWDYVLPAVEYSYPIFRSFFQKETGELEMVYPEHFKSRSQDLPKVFHDAGQFYWGKKSAWLGSKNFFGDTSSIYQLPEWLVQDIDTLEDWKYAELMFEALFKKNIITEVI